MASEAKQTSREPIFSEDQQQEILEKLNELDDVGHVRIRVRCGFKGRWGQYVDVSHEMIPDNERLAEEISRRIEDHLRVHGASQYKVTFADQGGHVLGELVIDMLDYETPAGAGEARNEMAQMLTIANQNTARMSDIVFRLCDKMVGLTEVITRQPIVTGLVEVERLRHETRHKEMEAETERMTSEHRLEFFRAAIQPIAVEIASEVRRLFRNKGAANSSADDSPASPLSSPMAELGAVFSELSKEDRERLFDIIGERPSDLIVAAMNASDESSFRAILAELRKALEQLAEADRAAALSILGASSAMRLNQLFTRYQE